MSIANEDRSWIIRRKATGEVLFETHSKAVADAINRNAYEVIPIRKYLAEVNRKARQQ